MPINGVKDRLWRAVDADGVVIAGDAIKYAKEAINGQCDMAFDTIEAGTRSIQHILAIADRIVPGHFSELTRLPNGNFSWDARTEPGLGGGNLLRVMASKGREKLRDFSAASCIE